jgi:hypothetical protein
MRPNDLRLTEPPTTPKDHERAVTKWFVLKGDPALRAAAAEILRLAEIERQYWELIYAVAAKWPDESRHQTALRYIQERERPQTEANAQCSTGQE